MTNLSAYGIEEVEANVCEDSSENRRILKDAGLPYKLLDVGLIEVTLPDEPTLSTHHSEVYEKRKGILVDQKNPWSDYLPFDSLPLDYMESAPAWIQRHLNKYKDAVEDGTPEHKLPILPTRCKRVRADGTRCWNWSWPAASTDGFCRFHCNRLAFNATEQMARLNDAAKMRLSQLTEPSITALEDLVINSTVPHVRLKAATEILDRVGIRGGTELSVSGQVDHNVLDPSIAVRERLKSLAQQPTAELPTAEPSEPIIDAEIVEVEDAEEA